MSDPTTANQVLARSTDGGVTWTITAPTLSVSNAETAVLGIDVEGGEGAGSTMSYMLAGAFRAANDDATVFVSMDGGATWGSAIEVATGSGYDGTWEVMYLSGTGATSVWLAFLYDSTATLGPRVYKSTDGGATWAAQSAAFAVADGSFQGVFQTASGAILVGTTDAGKIYRSTDDGATWTMVQSLAATYAAEVKARRFHQLSSGTIYCAGQNAGYIWESIDDGLTWRRVQRLARACAPIAMTGDDHVLLIGGGQGYITSTGGRAEVFRSRISYWGD